MRWRSCRIFRRQPIGPPVGQVQGAQNRMEDPAEPPENHPGSRKDGRHPANRIQGSARAPSISKWSGDAVPGPSVRPAPGSQDRTSGTREANAFGISERGSQRSAAQQASWRDQLRRGENEPAQVGSRDIRRPQEAAEEGIGFTDLLGKVEGKAADREVGIFRRS